MICLVHNNAGVHLASGLLSALMSIWHVCVGRVKDSAILWSMLALARLYLATVQTGYIHPDEFHQSVQVMAREY